MSYTSREVYEFISQQTSDPIIEWRTCDVSGTEFPIFQSDKDFLDKISPSFAGQKFVIPLPTICPEERERRRLLFRNERKLYRRKCSASGKDIISNYSSDKSYKIYDKEYRWSDNRDPLHFGRDWLWESSFSDTFRLLYDAVPRPSSILVSSLGSDYNNHAGYLKNCYMCCDVWWIEDSMYISRSYYDKNSLDLTYTGNCENCYQLVESFECTSCTYSLLLSKCYDCHWTYACQWCSSCFLCSNLTNKSYCIYNKQYTKEQYKQIIQELITEHDAKWFQQQYDILIHNALYSACTNINCENSVGNYLKNCTHSILSFSVQDSEYMRYCNGESGGQYIMDDNFSWWQPIGSAQYNYMTIWCESSHHLLFCFSCWQWCSNLLYCDFCHSCSYCFWCIWLRNKSYCIFNKQYTQEDYEIQVAKIIAHMQSSWERWEFFHPSLSPFGYNETVAYEYYPLSPSEAWTRGYKRQINNYDPIIPAWVDTLCKKDLPDRERSMLRETDDILKKIIICESSGRPFRIIRQELDYYRAHHLPLPSYHPDVRHEQRNTLRPWKQLFLRNCIACATTMLSVYETEEKIYCESCYQKEVFG